jgi:hypothetical protein
MSWDLFGTIDRTLRIKWIRHLCQDAPWNTVPVALFKPEFASDMTSFTPSRPRTFNDRRNAILKPSFFRVADVETDHFPRASAATPAATTIA